LFGSRGEGNTLIKDLASFERFIQGKNLSNYIYEKFYSYSREYRLHVSKEGCFYTCRKMLKSDTPEDQKWHRHDTNSVWIMEENPAFDKPVNWDSIVADCVNALEALDLDICGFDVKVQSAKDSKGRTRENPEWFLIESGSACSFGEVTAQKYIEHYPIVATRKAQEAGII